MLTPFPCSYIGQGQPTEEDRSYGGCEVCSVPCSGALLPGPGVRGPRGTLSSFPYYGALLLSARLSRTSQLVLSTMLWRCSRSARQQQLQQYEPIHCCTAPVQVVDWTDHVWTECYSEHQSRWVQPRPLRGRLRYAPAVRDWVGQEAELRLRGVKGRGEGRDSTVAPPAGLRVAQRRHEAPEGEVSALVGRLCEGARRGVSEERRGVLRRRDEGGRQGA